MKGGEAISWPREVAKLKTKTESTFGGGNQPLPSLFTIMEESVRSLINSNRSLFGVKTFTKLRSMKSIPPRGSTAPVAQPSIWESSKGGNHRARRPTASQDYGSRRRTRLLSSVLCFCFVLFSSFFFLFVLLFSFLPCIKWGEAKKAENGGAEKAGPLYCSLYFYFIYLFNHFSLFIFTYYE